MICTSTLTTIHFFCLKVIILDKVLPELYSGSAPRG